MYDCLICGTSDNTCTHFAFATLGYLFYKVRLFANSWTWNDHYSALANRNLVLGELRVNSSQGNYLLTLTTKGKCTVIDNVPKVLKELARFTFEGIAIPDTDEQEFCINFMNRYITLEELPQFLTSDSAFLRDIAETRFQEITAELNLQEKDHIDRLVI